MAQFKIYGDRDYLEASAPSISAAIHRASVEALGLPKAKRFHRFLPLDPWQYSYPGDRSSRYLIIEVMMFAGRPRETIKAFYSCILRHLLNECGIDAQDIEVVITESPRHNWLIRGVPGDDLVLGYTVDHVADPDL